MSTFIRYLRMYLHTADGQKRPIGYLSQYGDILRVSFDRDYIDDPQRDEAARHDPFTLVGAGATVALAQLQGRR